jgi:SAM-dependent methyltransferase
MHAEAFAYIRRQVRTLGPFASAVEFGGRDINGSVRTLFACPYTSVDLAAGSGVDVVDDAADWKPDLSVDVVVCCEVLEHAPAPETLIESAARALRDGGLLLVTAATDPRTPHSASDGGRVADGEHYANVSPDDLKRWLTEAGFVDIAIETYDDRGDIYAAARRTP